MSQSGNKPGAGGGFNRREFLQGSGAAAAATALSGGEALAEQRRPRRGPDVVRGPTTVTLQVNGKSHQVTVEPRTTLLEVLRDQLDLTGAKLVSMDGSSGASTVLVDDRPVTASTTLAISSRDKKIRTVESLGGDSPDAVPKAFVKHDAQQCGFCTPGFVVAVRAFLDRHPQATEAEIRQGLNGNICRCGTYADIIRAALDVVKGT